MTERQLKVDRLAWTLIITLIMFLALGGFWSWLEIVMFGEIKNNPVDNIVSIPILVSFWFNAKSIVLWIKKVGK